MRVLFTTHPALGRFHPLVPLASALVSARHDVAFVSAPAFCPDIMASGFSAIPADLDWLKSELLATFPRFLDVLASSGMPAAVSWVVLGVFAGETAMRMAADLLPICQDWRPDLIVREPMEFGGYLAAEALDLPHATVEVGNFNPYTGYDGAVAQSLDRLRVDHGLSPDPGLARLYHFLHLSAAPPRYQNPTVPLPSTAHALRPVVFDRSGDEVLPPWVGDLPDQPTSYATLGTVVNRRPGILPAILDGLRDEPITLVLTVGRNQAPADFGPQPDNVHIARYIPARALRPTRVTRGVQYCHSGDRAWTAAGGYPPGRRSTGARAACRAARSGPGHHARDIFCGGGTYGGARGACRSELSSARRSIAR